MHVEGNKYVWMHVYMDDMDTQIEIYFPLFIQIMTYYTQFSAP